MAPKLPTRKLGKNGPEVVAEGFGLMGLSIWYGSIQSDEERFKVLDRAYELGQTNWDTASIYGDNEELVGKWFKRTGKRDEIFLATKVRRKYGEMSKEEPQKN
jgi:aryl-alcohol dehydrogenase-like predicted oxidoreductase